LINIGEIMTEKKLSKMTNEELITEFRTCKHRTVYYEWILKEVSKRKKEGQIFGAPKEETEIPIPPNEILDVIKHGSFKHNFNINGQLIEHYDYKGSRYTVTCEEVDEEK